METQRKTQRTYDDMGTVRKTKARRNERVWYYEESFFIIAKGGKQEKKNAFEAAYTIGYLTGRGGEPSMNDMIVKSVDLMGDTVMAAKDSDGNIWAGINFFCKALGMSKGQRDRQVQNVQTDETLKRGASKLEAGVFDKDNETVVLKIEYVPLWLTKITITEKTKKAHPELAGKLLEYQLKAKDILAAAFLPKQEYFFKKCLTHGYTYAKIMCVTNRKEESYWAKKSLVNELMTLRFSKQE